MIYASLEEEIQRLIDASLIGSVNFREFEKRFQYLFLDAERYPSFSTEAEQLFTEILEKLSWAEEVISEDDRKDGWQTADEFAEWLRKAKAAMPSQRPVQ